MSTVVRVRAIRPFWAGGDSFLPGAIVVLSPLDAASVLNAGRGVVLNDDDLKTIVAAVKAQTAATIRSVEAANRGVRGVIAQQGDTDSWRPLR